MTLSLFILIGLQCFCLDFCDAEELAAVSADGSRYRDGNKDGNCTEDADEMARPSCIEIYDDLESYVKGNSEVTEQLKGAFFVTGRPPPKFVHLTYNVQVLCNGVKSCTNYTSMYIWSDWFQYLLGPQPLFWFTPAFCCNGT